MAYNKERSGMLENTYCERKTSSSTNFSSFSQTRWRIDFSSLVRWLISLSEGRLAEAIADVLRVFMPALTDSCMPAAMLCFSLPVSKNGQRSTSAINSRIWVVNYKMVIPMLVMPVLVFAAADADMWTVALLWDMSPGPHSSSGVVLTI